MQFSVVGLGSLSRRDDAVGLVLVDRLRHQRGIPGADLAVWENADGATVAANLLALGTPVMLVDCADMGLMPGQFKVFDRNGAELNVQLDVVTTHGSGLADGLELAHRLGFELPVKIFGVQPFDLSPGLELSPRMESHLDELLVALGAAVAEMVAA